MDNRDAEIIEEPAALFMGLRVRIYHLNGLILRYAFTEQNLQRVSLNVFEYNPRAIRSYEKVGFKHEGRSRGVLHRAGRRWDLIFMGILRAEWEAQQKNH